MTNDRTNARLLMIGTAVLVVLFIASQVVAHNLMGGATNIEVNSAPPILGQAAQPLVNKSTTTTSAGYVLQGAKYFDNNTWVVATVVPPTKSIDSGIIIMQKIGQFYIPVVGPTTSLPNTVTEGLPSDVSQYLNNKGLVYNAS